MIAGQHENEPWRLHPQDVDILIEGIRGARVPSFPHSLLGGKHVQELLQRGVQEVPASLQVLDQAVRLVLGRDTDPANAGIDAIAEREIDDAVLATERHRGLGTPIGQLLQPRASPTRQDDGVGIAYQRRDRRPPVMFASEDRGPKPA